MHGGREGGREGGWLGKGYLRKVPGWSTTQQTACLGQSSASHTTKTTLTTATAERHSILIINIEGKDNSEIIFINVLLYIMYSIRAEEKETNPPPRPPVR